jgi:DNA-binding GntR family transcriptional regulator
MSGFSQNCHRRSSATTEEYDTPDTRKQVIRIHAQIISAIEARDRAEAVAGEARK